MAGIDEDLPRTRAPGTALDAGNDCSHIADECLALDAAGETRVDDRMRDQRLPGGDGLAGVQ